MTGIAPDTSLVELNYGGESVGYVYTEEGPYAFSSYGSFGITTPTVEVEIVYISCTRNWEECDPDDGQNFPVTVGVDYN
ncbi:hypothetical protein ABIE38_003515 [Dietzia sp. 2505]|uniref:hypothetical protein n=1 Tax=unclassified Dietzia TaxID=2617939 RepID=UPI0015FCFFCC|nr:MULTISPECIES: hypothetical protein [unclassified Dietzia]MBB1055626.1 hypothetical protein [Dietzia sp. B44]MBB1058619.1 hypothetical protein [Dietzia sp. B19]